MEYSFFADPWPKENAMAKGRGVCIASAFPKFLPFFSLVRVPLVGVLLSGAVLVGFVSLLVLSYQSTTYKNWYLLIPDIFPALWHNCASYVRCTEQSFAMMRENKV